MSSVRLFGVAALVAATLVSSGCSGSGTNDQEVAESQMLKDLTFALREYAERNNGAAPKSAKDLMPLEPSFPGALRALNGGHCVYIWGSKLQDGSSLIIAYEKEVETNGGAVLLADGTVKRMSAGEFAAAPKAK